MMKRWRRSERERERAATHTLFEKAYNPSNLHNTLYPYRTSRYYAFLSSSSGG